MKSIKKTLLYGFLIWLFPFVIAFSIFPIRVSNRVLFESIMPVVLTVSVVFFTYLYFKKLEDNFIKEGVMLGIIWLAISFVMDLAMFMEGPMKMAFSDYVMDIGLIYLMIPIMTVGFGYLSKTKTKKVS
jgi:uncharacterized membrane protein